MTRDEIMNAMARCQKEIDFWAVEAEHARDEWQAAEAMCEEEESNLEDYQAMLDELEDE